MEFFGIFRVVIEEFPVVCIAGLEVVDTAWVGVWGSVLVVLAVEPHVSSGSVVEFFWSLRNVAHVPESVGLFRVAAVSIDPPVAVVVRAGSGLSDCNAHWVSVWCWINFILAAEPNVSSGSVIELLWRMRNVSHIPEGVSLFGESTVSINPPGTVVVWTGLSGVQTGLLLVVLLVVSVVMFSTQASNLSVVDTHWMTGWGGIVSVETSNLGFSSEAPELLWRSGSVTHVPEVVLFFGTTRVAVVPASG